MKILLTTALLLACSFSLSSQSQISADKALTPDHEISDCPDLITISGPIVKDLYQATDIHLTDVIVFPIIELSLISETQVDLNSEIEVPAGSTLTIDIDDCPSNPEDEPEYRPSSNDKEKRTSY